jgi:hypothetical protein
MLQNVKPNPEVQPKAERRRFSDENFCAMRGYIASARKNGRAAVSCIAQSLSGNPYFPPHMTLPSS